MKKITILFLLVFSMSAISQTRYLVELGTGVWRTAGVGEQNVSLSNLSNDFNTWYNAMTWVAGDEVWVAAGDYIITASISLKNDVDVYGGFIGTETSTSQRVKGANSWDFTNETIIDANNASITHLGVGTITTPTFFDGFTVTKSAVAKTSGNTSIGAVQGTIVLKNCKFTDNTLTRTTGTATMSGGIILRTGASCIDSYFYNNRIVGTDGAIYLRGGAVTLAGEVLVKGCTFENNYADNGGGAINIFSNNTANSAGGTFENCIFKNNNGNTGNGGAVYIGATQPHSANTVFKKCIFTANTAAASGALHHNGANGTNTTNIAIEGCIFENNIATTGTGGALGMNPAGAPTIQYVKNCIFRGNKTATAGQNGAALTTNKAYPVINCVFANNTGLNTIYQSGADLKIYNCTFANNDSEAGGGTIRVNADVNSTLKNNIFWGNSIKPVSINEGYAGILTTEYNAFDSDMSGQIFYGTAGSIMTLNTTNTFVSPSTFVGAPTNDTQKAESDIANWSLKSGCPAIDAGSTLAEVTTDINGGARPSGAGYDMGAYEFGAISAIRNPSLFDAKISVNAGSLQIETENISTVTLYSITGTIQSRTNPALIHNFNLNKGVFIIRIDSDNGKQIQKVLIQ